LSGRASFSIAREDWSLHRQGELDQRRHQEKVKEALRRNLADLVSEEAIITASGDKIIKIPIRSLEEFRFRYNPGKQNYVGQGEGNTPQGKALEPGKPGGGESGWEKGAGEGPGADYYEAEITVEELEELIFEDLGLPRLKNRDFGEVTKEVVKFNDVRKKGLAANLDKKRTLLATLRRTAQEGNPGLRNIAPDDLRFKTWEIVPHPQARAVVLAMMDTSGSMGRREKYLARSFFYWMVRFLRTRYQSVEIVFLAHDAAAREVNEEQFFTKGESGGTRCSSVYQLALELIAERYSSAVYEIYAFHFSDGENLPSDNELCVELVKQLLEYCNLVGYGEIGPDEGDLAAHYDLYYGAYPFAADSKFTLGDELKRIKHPHFVSLSISHKGDVYRALREFFKLSEKEAAV